MAARVFHSWSCLLLICIWTTRALEMPYHFIGVHSDNYPLPSLPYDYSGLEPYIDEATVNVHHKGHHAAYTKKMNAALTQWLADHKEVKPGALSPEKPIIEILRRLEDVPEKYKTSIRNNGGGYVNHNFYWSVMSPNPMQEEREPTGQLKTDIDRDFGNFSNFKELFTKEALALFGSGYVWLSREPKTETLLLSTTANQDCPVTERLQPILVLDVWEHAYYLKHQNRRPKHVSDWWNLVDWSRVMELDDWWKRENTQHDEF